MKKEIITLAASALIGGITAYAVTTSVAPKDTFQTVVSGNDGATYRTVNLNLSDYPDFTYAAESAVDAVVYVKVAVPVQQMQMPSSIFDFFFGMPGQGYGDGRGQGTPREQYGSGSGVIIRQDGYIVTNNHVVGDASRIEVTLNNNQTYEASLVGTDPATDVALIKIEAEGLPVIPFADSDKLRLGEWVLAIGSPYDLRSTITAGIVSAKGRSMPNYGKDLKIESFIQTDAAVNPGNSGGALVNKEGLLVGVNTAIISQTGSYAGYSFAIPSNIVRKIADDLMTFGSVKRVMLGVSVMEIDAKKAQELKLSSPMGVYIGEVSKGSAGDKAGLKEGDVLVGLDSTKINSFAALQEALSQFRPGDKATVRIIRDGKELSVPVTFQDQVAQNGQKLANGIAFYGATLAKASKETLEKLGLKNGVEIVSVGPGKIQEAGAREGFVITYVNDVPVEKPQDILNIVKKSKRAVYIEGVDANGRASYFGFGL
ncbi:MAG: Do family serine endopeptidase [Bacteroidales bacterium]|nr:Do family serine endopeptidase [Bacteroidales bacterium]